MINAQEIYKILNSSFKIKTEEFTALVALEHGDAFDLLIATILSQNTSDRNSIKTYLKLKREIGITPKSLAKASIEEIEKYIKPGGLYKVKARNIKKVAEVILNKYDGKIERILKKPLDEARRELLSLPGVGPKTADLVLLLAGNRPTIPIDVHINRVSKRIGLARNDADYEEVRRALMQVFKPEQYNKIHHLLILLGRRICRPRNPKCDKCPISNYCRFFSISRQ